MCEIFLEMLDFWSETYIAKHHMTSDSVSSHETKFSAYL
jgi:hypothetical protein